MSFKVFAAFFVALLAVNVSQQNPLKDDSIKDLVVVVFNKVLSITGNLLTKVNEDLKYFESHEPAIKSKVLADVIVVAKTVSKKIFELIDELEDAATADGKAILKCIAAEHGKTDDAIKVTAADVVDCVGAEADIVLPVVKKIVGELGDLQADVRGQVDTLCSCSDGELSCLVAFLQTVDETGKKIVTAFKSDFQKVVDLVRTVLKELKKCDLKTHLKANAQKIFNEAVVCIKA